MARLFFLSFMLFSCSAPVGLQNFHEVDPGKVYRSAQPDAAGYSEIKKLGIRTVLKLNTESDIEEAANAQANGIRLVKIPLSGILAPSKVDERRVQAVLIDRSLQPVLVHCEWGKDRTGLAAAIYRVDVQGWKQEAAHKEWMDLGHSPLLSMMDKFFSEFFRHSQL